MGWFVSDIDISAVVHKLIGPINPVGESGPDEQRLANLKVMTVLIEDLMYEVNKVAHNKTRYEHSMQLIGKHADGFIRYIVNEHKERDA